MFLPDGTPFYAWKRLLILRRAIVNLPSRFLILTQKRWTKITTNNVIVLLSGAKYVTISLMYPAISRLITEIQPNSEYLITEIDDEAGILENIKKL